MTALRLLAPLLLCPLVACSDAPKPAKDAPATASAAAPADPAAAFAQALEAIHAARPEGVRLEFDAGTVDKARILAARPTGWDESSVIPGNFKPPSDAKLGFLTSYRVGSNCDGACKAKDWKAVAEKVDLGQFRNTEKFTILSEATLADPPGVLLVVKSKAGTQDTTYIAAARWKTGAPRYYTCHVTLEGAEAAKLTPVFAKVCAVNRSLMFD